MLHLSEPRYIRLAPTGSIENHNELSARRIHADERRVFRRSSVEACRKAFVRVISFWRSTRKSGCTIVAQIVPNIVVLHKYRARREVVDSEQQRVELGIC